MGDGSMGGLGVAIKCEDDEPLPTGVCGGLDCFLCFHRDASTTLPWYLPASSRLKASATMRTTYHSWGRVRSSRHSWGGGYNLPHWGTGNSKKAAKLNDAVKDDKYGP